MIVDVGELSLSEWHSRRVSDTIEEPEDEDGHESVKKSKKEHRYSREDNSEKDDEKCSNFFGEIDEWDLRTKCRDGKNGDEHIPREKLGLEENIVPIGVDDFIKEVHEECHHEGVPETKKHHDRRHNEEPVTQGRIEEHVCEGSYILLRCFNHLLHIYRLMELERFQEDKFHTSRYICEIGFLYLCDRVLFDGFESLFCRDDFELADIGEIHIDREFGVIKINDDEDQEQYYKNNENGDSKEDIERENHS